MIPLVVFDGADILGITYSVLGSPGRDNALLVQVDSGQATEKLLFDCGEGCLAGLSYSDVQAVDHLFFSHLHMDHVAGFDSYFRCNYNRSVKPNRIWGPPGTARILQHRFQGFLWNLHEEMAGRWDVHDIHPDRVQTSTFELTEAFSREHDGGTRPYKKVILEGAGFEIEAVTMDHRTPTIAYILREKNRRNIDTSRLASMGLRPGPWLKHLKDSPGVTDSVVIDGVTHDLEAIQKAILVESKGESIAYLTDFLLDETAMDQLAESLRGCRTIVCESQYRHADMALAHRNFHMTNVLTATLALRAQAGELVLFHLSDRYETTEWVDMINEARLVFPNTRYPKHWNL